MNYNSDHWVDWPLLFIPASWLWVNLDVLCEKHGLLDKLYKKYPQYSKYTVRKWLHRVTGFIAHIITLPIILLIALLFEKIFE